MKKSIINKNDDRTRKLDILMATIEKNQRNLDLRYGTGKRTREEWISFFFIPKSSDESWDFIDATLKSLVEKDKNNYIENFGKTPNKPIDEENKPMDKEKLDKLWDSLTTTFKNMVEKIDQAKEKSDHPKKRLNWGTIEKLKNTMEFIWIGWWYSLVIILSIVFSL